MMQYCLDDNSLPLRHECLLICVPRINHEVMVIFFFVEHFSRWNLPVDSLKLHHVLSTCIIHHAMISFLLDANVLQHACKQESQPAMFPLERRLSEQFAIPVQALTRFLVVSDPGTH